MKPKYCFYSMSDVPSSKKEAITTVSRIVQPRRTPMMLIVNVVILLVRELYGG